MKRNVGEHHAAAICMDDPHNWHAQYDRQQGTTAVFDMNSRRSHAQRDVSILFGVSEQARGRSPYKLLVSSDANSAE